MEKPKDHRLAILARCEGMDNERAARLLDLLPVLGVVPSQLLLPFADLEPSYRCSSFIIPRRRVEQVQAVLLEAVAVARKGKTTRTATLLRRLGKSHPEENMRLCLTAMLRHFNETLLHAGKD